MFQLAGSDLCRLAQVGFKLGHISAQESRNYRVMVEATLNTLAAELSGAGWIWKRGELIEESDRASVVWSEQVSNLSDSVEMRSTDQPDWCSVWNQVQQQQRSLTIAHAPNEGGDRLIRFRIDPSGSIDWVELVFSAAEANSHRNIAFADALLELVFQNLGRIEPVNYSKQVNDLPKRQREVLAMLLHGASIKEIAAELGISPHTVNDYSQSVYRTFQVAGRAELAALFLENGQMAFVQSGLMQVATS